MNFLYQKSDLCPQWLVVSLVSFRFDLFRFVLFRFVSICFVSFRSVSFHFDLFRFVSICFVSFRFVSVSFRTLQGPLKRHSRRFPFHFKESLTTMSNKLGMMEAETRGGMVSLSRQSSEIMVKVDNMKEFARLAQDPNPTADMVTETVSSILVHVGTANNESRVGGLHNLPTTAQTFPKLLAIKYGRYYASYGG